MQQNRMTRVVEGIKHALGASSVQPAPQPTPSFKAQGTQHLTNYAFSYAGVVGNTSAPVHVNQGISAASLPEPPMPEAPTGQTSVPSFRTQVDRSDDLLAKTNRVTANTDATTFRTGSVMSDVIRNFLEANPDMAATVNAYLRVGIPKGYKLTGHDLDGRINREATAAAHEILTRITFLADPTAGYNPTTDLHSLSETLGRELLLEGAASLELVLDDMGSPIYPAPVAVSTLQFKEDADKGVFPVQVIGGDEIPLDLATMFYVSVDQDLLTPYAVAYLGVAVRAVLADEGFSNFLQRQLKRNIAPRLVAKIVEEKLKKSVDPKVLNDPTKFRSYVTGLITSIQTQLEDLEPEQALISTDMVEYDTKMPGGTGAGVGTLLESVHGILESRVTAALKSLPAVLGRDTSSGSATTSTMLFLKSAAMLSTKLNVLYSRMLTIAVRLLGHNCYVKFEYDHLDLRPEPEQAAYRSMQQSTVLEQLSLGFITDEQACIMLTGQLPPDGYVNKSGTMFKSNAGAAQNTTSQTSLMNGQPDNLKSDAPTGAKGD